MVYFQTKNPSLCKLLEGSAMEDVGLFYVHLVNSAYFVAIWYIFPGFGTFLPVLVCCTKNNLATLYYGPSCLHALVVQHQVQHLKDPGSVQGGKT
jgi:hypothetical protein